MALMRVRRVLAVATVAYVVALGVLVAAPWGWELNRLTVRLWVWVRSDWPIVPAWMGPEHYGVLLNVALFVPLAALMTILTRWPWWRVVLVAALFSGLIELAQWAWLEREASWSDVGANTLGALVGAVAVSPLARRGSRRAGRSELPRRP